MIQMIVRPLYYLKITWPVESGEGDFDQKKIVDFYMPLIASLVFTALICALYFLADSKAFFETKGFDLITTFLLTMPGFFIAALAAITTFQSKWLDDIPEDSPLDHKGLAMSRRRFLANAFAYLTILSMGSLVFCGFVGFFYTADVLAVSAKLYGFAYTVVFFIFMFLVAQLMSITAMTLYYLGDRIHRP